MSYLDIKKQFIQITGRYDLVQNLTDYNSSNPYGIDEVIYAGQRKLDSIAWERRQEFNWYRKDIAIDDFKLDIPNLKSLKEVWLTGKDGGHKILTKESLGYIREVYGEASTLLNRSAPICFALAVNKLSQDQIDLTVGNYTNEFTYDADDLHFGENWSYDTILFYPRSDAVYTISILGKFYEKQLINDTDKNFWSEEYPETLITAGKYILERNLRNRTGMVIEMDNIIGDLKGLLDDKIEEEISGKSQVAG